MRAKKISRAFDAFHKLERAQSEWDDSFNDLSEAEEAELEKRMFAEGVTISKPSVNQKETKEENKNVH